MTIPDQENQRDDLAIEQLTYEDAFSQLEEIVGALEAGDHPLDQALRLFERGQSLARHCASLLDQADIKVKKLVGESLVEFTIE